MQISKIEVHSRTFPRCYDSRRMGRQLQKYNQAPRIYVSIEGENILQNLANRTVRPNVLYKKLIKNAVLSALGVSSATHDLVWSQKAGCSMCPCSPGFILKHKPDASYAPTTPSRSFDVWVTISGDDAAIADGKQPRFVAELV